MKANRINQSPQVNTALREKGKVGTQQHNKDRIGARSGAMETGDRRRDKYGSRHNQDAQGLQSPRTAELRETMTGVRARQGKRHRTGSRK